MLDFFNKHRFWVLGKFKKKKKTMDSGYLKTLKQPSGFIKNYQVTFLGNYLIKKKDI
jgi:hypothetical protein